MVSLQQMSVWFGLSVVLVTLEWRNYSLTLFFFWPYLISATFEPPFPMMHPISSFGTVISWVCCWAGFRACPVKSARAETKNKVSYPSRQNLSSAQSQHLADFLGGGEGSRNDCLTFYKVNINSGLKIPKGNFGPELIFSKQKVRKLRGGGSSKKVSFLYWWLA